MSRPQQPQAGLMSLRWQWPDGQETLSLKASLWIAVRDFDALQLMCSLLAADDN
jgi:hypothetical protein